VKLPLNFSMYLCNTCSSYVVTVVYCDKTCTVNIVEETNCMLRVTNYKCYSSPREWLSGIYYVVIFLSNQTTLLGYSNFHLIILSHTECIH